MFKKRFSIAQILIGVAVILLPLYLAVFFLPSANADANVNNGAIIDVSVTDSVITCKGSRPGSLLNKGSATVYINWDGGAVEENNNAGDNKCYLEQGDSTRIPSNVKKFSIATASSTAKVIFIQE